MNRIEGPRVLLRLPLPSDEAEFIESSQRSREMHADLVHPATTSSGFASYLSKNEDESNLCLLVVERETSRIAGTVNLSQIFRGPFRNAYLGYYLFEGFTGRGIMTEALKLLIEFAFGDFGLHRLEANIQPENEPSIRLAERCGFRKEGYSMNYLMVGGEWRDHERWAITAEDLRG